MTRPIVEPPQFPVGDDVRNLQLLSFAPSSHHSINHFVQLHFPSLKGFQCLSSQHGLRWNFPSRPWLRQFPANQFVVKLDPRRVPPRIAVVDFTQACPINRGQTHRAWFAACVNLAFIQAKGFKFPARGSNRHDFRMRRGVILGGDLIPSAGDDLFFVNDHGAKRAAAIGTHLGKRQPNGFPHKFFLHAESLTEETGDSSAFYPAALSTRRLETPLLTVPKTTPINR
jgi:hypothetical protein